MDYNFKPGYQYYKLYKPFGVLTQFSKDTENQKCLKDIIQVSRDVYPVGRLDKDSEGLLILSNDAGLTDWLLNPKNKRAKTYWAQVEGIITDEAIERLAEGVSIKIKKKDFTVKAADISKLEEVHLPERIPPIRKRESIPTSWIELSISQGKNRQIRRMLAKLGFPVLRLARYRIEDLTIEGMEAGELVPLVNL